MSGPSSTSERHWVFAYGSNMDLADLARWLDEKGYPALEPRAVHRARLPGHRLVWDYRSVARDGGAANVVPHPELELPGVVLEVCDGLLEAIDAKEGRSYFRRTERLLLDDERALEAWVYRVRDAYRQPRYVPPRRAYLDIMLRAARTHALPDEHIRILGDLSVHEDHDEG